MVSERSGPFWKAPRGRARRRWTISLLVGVVLLLGWLDLERPNGLFGWAFVVVAAAAATVGVRWARRSDEVAARQPVSEGAPGPIGVWVLFREALMLGITGFGGSLAVLSQIEQRWIERRRWVPFRR